MEVYMTGESFFLPNNPVCTIGSNQNWVNSTQKEWLKVPVSLNNSVICYYNSKMHSILALEMVLAGSFLVDIPTLITHPIYEMQFCIFVLKMLYRLHSVYSPSDRQHFSIVILIHFCTHFPNLMLPNIERIIGVNGRRQNITTPMKRKN